MKENDLSFKLGLLIVLGLLSCRTALGAIILGGAAVTGIFSGQLSDRLREKCGALFFKEMLGCFFISVFAMGFSYGLRFLYYPGWLELGYLLPVSILFSGTLSRDMAVSQRGKISLWFFFWILLLGFLRQVLVHPFLGTPAFAFIAAGSALALIEFLRARKRWAW